MRTLLRRSLLGASLTLTCISLVARAEEGPSAPPRHSPPSSCLACHADVTRAGHPMETAGGPACLACHTEPASESRHRATGAGADLRVSARESCAACHGGRSGRYGRLGHALLLGRVHTTSEASTGQSARAGLGAGSRLCMGCHDGAAAIAADVRQPGNDAKRGVNWKREHPIGVPYGRGVGSEVSVALHPERGLPPEVGLENGTVGCISCHSPYSEEKSMLAVAGPSSNLCLVCHVK